MSAATEAVQQFVERNAAFAATFDKNRLTPQGTIVVGCMDPRINFYAQLGLEQNIAVTRNAGGSAKEALRSILVAQFFGARHVALFQHTDCGRLRFTTASVQDHYKNALPGNDAAAEAVEHIHDFGDATDIEVALGEDVAFVRGHPLVFGDTVVSGWVYDVETGKIKQLY